MPPVPIGFEVDDLVLEVRVAVGRGVEAGEGEFPGCRLGHRGFSSVGGGELSGGEYGEQTQSGDAERAPRFDSHAIPLFCWHISISRRLIARNRSAPSRSWGG